MANNDFFEDNQGKIMDEQPTDQVIKLGDKEYSQADLEELVGLGEIGRELESQWKTDIRRVYPEFTKKSQRVSELEQEVEGLKKNQTQTSTQQTSSQLPEDVKAQAIAQLKEWGFVPAEEVQKVASQVARETLTGYQLLNEVEQLIGKQASDGNPQTSPEALLSYMDENGIRNPEKAYKLMFEDELDQIREKKIQSLKSPGLYTERTSSAGAKAPEQVKLTKNNLEDVLISTLRGGGGQ